MKVTLSEIKKIYREPTAEEMKPRMKSMFGNTKKKKGFNQNSRN